MSCRFHRTEFDLLPDRAFRPRAGRRGPMTLEGGKGSSAPAPDPRLVDAQIKSMGVQDNAIQSVLQQSAELMPLQKQQLQFGLDSAKTAYDQAQADREWSLGRRNALSGIQDKLVSEANDFNTGDRATQLVAQSGADVNSAFANAKAASDRDLARRGIMPGSGAQLSMSGAQDIAKASAMAAGAAGARTQARSEGYALEDRATNALAGYPASASAATGAGAQYAASGLGLANQGAAGINSGATSAAQIAGQMGTNATSMFGAQANYAANTQQSSDLGGIGSILGGAASLYKSGIFSSDRRLKRDVVRVGEDPRGFGVYHFTYVDDVGMPGRFRGVMADEVEPLYPDAVLRDLHGFALVDYGRLGLRMETLQ